MYQLYLKKKKGDVENQSILTTPNVDIGQKKNHCKINRFHTYRYGQILK